MDKKIIKSLESRDGKVPAPKKKFNFKKCKENTVKSLYEVEHFLNNYNQFIKYIKLYKILK